MKKIFKRPTKIEWAEEEGDFKLFKYYGKKKVQEPFYITDNLNDFVAEVTACVEKWKCKFNYQAFLKFIAKYNKE